MLRAECDLGKVQWAQPCQVLSVAVSGEGYVVSTDGADYTTASLVIATGGLAIPQLGATPFGYKIAEQFGIPVVAPQPALVPLALPPETLAGLQNLSGASLEVATHFDGQQFLESMLITHKGLSGPAILQISSYWQNQLYNAGKKQPITINLLPHLDIAAWLNSHRHSKSTLAALLSEHLPKRFAQEWCVLQGWNKPLVEHSNKDVAAMIAALSAWELMPAGTLGYAKAEVTLGGVDTRALSSKTMSVKNQPNLYFIGEVVDVTGWLGGYNFQWAWSSGWVAGQFV
jgi:hypothetical protein